jgi:hypothetical protein
LWRVIYRPLRYRGRRHWLQVFPFRRHGVRLSIQGRVRFYLNDADDIDPAQVQPEIDGTTLGAAVPATGPFSDGDDSDRWQIETFSWNSGSNTSAVLTLNDLELGSYGNDFAVDDISVSADTPAPEPGTFWLFGGTALASLTWMWRKRAR